MVIYMYNRLKKSSLQLKFAHLSKKLCKGKINSHESLILRLRHNSPIFFQGKFVSRGVFYIKKERR